MNTSRIRLARLSIVLIVFASFLIPSVAGAVDSVSGCAAVSPGDPSCQFIMGNAGLAVITASLQSTNGASTCFVISGGSLTRTPPCVGQTLIGAANGTMFTISVYSSAVGQVDAATDVSSMNTVPQTSCTVQDWADASINCALDTFNPFASNGAPVDVEALSSGDLGATLRDADGNINPQVYTPDGPLFGPATASSGNPYGCYGQTDNVHYSDGDASVHARTECSTRLPYMRAETDLYRDRWYGEQYLASNSATSPYSPSVSRWRVEAVTRWRCAATGTYTYRAYTYHEVRDYSGNKYYANTYNLGRFGC